MVDKRASLLPLLAFLVTCVAGAAPPLGVAAAAPVHAHACGPWTQTHVALEPPNVDMWNAPVDASGVHELILGVHKDGDRYCYHYTFGGASYVASPTIRVHPGERFAIRIADDIVSRAPGQSVASTAMKPCKPMMMPQMPTQHWMGYLNHVIDDRPMPIVALDTNLHLHGFEGPASMENIFLSSLSTPLHACEYDVTMPLTQPTGTYLYHPHVHGGSDLQVGGGLDGVWIAEPQKPQLPRSDEHVLVIRYHIPYQLENEFQPNAPDFGTIGERHEASLPWAPPVRYDPFNPPPWPVAYPMQADGVTLDPTGCDSPFSDAVVTVDGADVPATLDVAGGRTQLLRIVNGTSDSAKLIVLRDASGNAIPMHVTGLDGVPVSGDSVHPLSRYVAFNELMLAPMSRADVVLDAAPGQTYSITAEHYCQGVDGFYQQHEDLLHVRAVAGEAPANSLASSEMAASQTPAAQMVAWARAHPSLVHRRAITFTEYQFPKRGRIPDHQAYYITDTTNPDFHEHPFGPAYRPGATFPDNPDIVVKQGTVEEWYLVNATMETHAFHIHQMDFVQERNYEGVPVTIDTVFVPVGHLIPNRRDPNFPLIVPSITRVILDFRHVPRGEFVFHCHMLFHEDRGMMGVIRVE
jgi:FtsP/CotA-like multicopper oxidase with cupredoxin domain